MTTTSSSNDHLGDHAQNILRKAVAENGNDWDRDATKRRQLLAEIRELDQKIAGHEQRHREFSAALSILDAVLPEVHQGARRAEAPATAEEFEHKALLSRAPTPYTVTIIEKRPGQ